MGKEGTLNAPWVRQAATGQLLHACPPGTVCARSCQASATRWEQTLALTASAEQGLRIGGASTLRCQGGFRAGVPDTRSVEPGRQHGGARGAEGSGCSARVRPAQLWVSQGAQSQRRQSPGASRTAGSAGFPGKSPDFQLLVPNSEFHKTLCKSIQRDLPEKEDPETPSFRTFL